MKKRILSLVLAAVMLVSMASVASAALADGCQVKFIVSADKTTVNPGDEVTISLSVEAAADDLVWGGGVFPMAYDNTLIEVPAAFRGVTVKGEANYSSFLTFNATGYGTIVDTSNTTVEAPLYDGGFTPRTEDTAKGYNTFSSVAVVANGTRHTFTVGTPEVIYSCKYTVADTVAPGTTINVGMPIGAFDGDPPIGMFYSEKTQIEYWVYYDGDVYDFSEANVALTVASAEKVSINDAAGTKIRYNAANDGTVDLGFTGSFRTADIAAAFDANGSSTNLLKVGAMASVNGGNEVEATDRFVYADGTDGYKFRIAITGIPAASTDSVAVRCFVVIDLNGNGVEDTDERFYSATTTTTAADHASRLPVA